MKKIAVLLLAGLLMGMALQVQQTADSVDLQKGLVAYYPFNGNANDESGNGHDGIVNGATLTTESV